MLTIAAADWQDFTQPNMQDIPNVQTIAAADSKDLINANLQDILNVQHISKPANHDISAAIPQDSQTSHDIPAVIIQRTSPNGIPAVIMQG
jgi:hypothetical protein